MGNVQPKKKRMAELYVNGPAFLKGNWEKSAIAAGLEEAPPADDPIMYGLVTKLGGFPPGTEPVAVEPAPAAEPEPSADDSLADVLAATEAGIPWTSIRGKLADVIRGVANGQVKASAAQVSMLKFVIAKAEEEAAAGEQVQNVILLPVQGYGAELSFAEHARLEVAAREAKGE